MRARMVVVVVIVVPLLVSSLLLSVGIAVGPSGSDGSGAASQGREQGPPQVLAGVPPGSKYGWTNPCRCPSAREGHTMVYDARSDRFVLFGGWDGAWRNETWSYDLGNRSWTKLAPSVSPSARGGLASAYDSRADRVILLGGFPGPGLSTETWAYDLETDTWTNRSPIGGPPAGSYFKGMAYDSESDRVVLVGGPYGVPTETWAYNFNVDTWTNMSPTQSITPAIRMRYAMVYDSHADRVILFGGQVKIGSFIEFTDETWAYDLNANAWTNMRPSGNPSARFSHDMAYDVRSDRTILFGGFAANGLNGETWAYDFRANTWSMRTPISAPENRFDHTLSYDVRLNRSVLFGGGTNALFSHEVWAYQLETDAWTRYDPARPSAPLWPAMAYDSQSDRVILYGGATPWVSGETWAYDADSNDWTRMDPSSGPPPTIGHAMVYDAQADRIILFGGQNNGQTWAYDLETNTWTVLNPPGSPSTRLFHAMAYDSESDRTILFGGDTAIGPSPWDDETWAYDFNTNRWTNMTPGETVRPSPRSGHLMTYDVQADRILLFGGSMGIWAHNDTWAYDFNTNAWTNVTPAVGPSARVSQAMAYDSQLDLVILDGSRETWAYDSNATTWVNVSSAVAPSSLGGHAMTYDTQSRRAVLFAFDDTWLGRLLFLPSPPRAPRATGGSGQVTVSWQPPLDDGGSPISVYRVYRGTSSGNEGFSVSVGNVLVYDDRDVTSGQTYYYRISAVNEVGEGPLSEETSATPADAPPGGAGVPPVLILITGIAIAAGATGIGLLVWRRRKRRGGQEDSLRGPP